MRLDKYLKISRLIKRRTVANEACDAGKILVNDKVARASYDVKAGDVIEIQMGQKALKVRVEQVLKSSARRTLPVFTLWFQSEQKQHHKKRDRKADGIGCPLFWSLFS